MKLKITDRDLTCLFYFFMICAFCSIAAGFYDKLFAGAATMDLSSFYTFLFFAVFSRYYYAVIYVLRQLERINREERLHHLAIAEKSQNNKS